MHACPACLPPTQHHVTVLRNAFYAHMYSCENVKNILVGMSFLIIIKIITVRLQRFLINSELITRINRVGINAALLNRPAFTMGMTNPS